MRSVLRAALNPYFSVLASPRTSTSSWAGFHAATCVFSTGIHPLQSPRPSPPCTTRTPARTGQPSRVSSAASSAVYALRRVSIRFRTNFSTTFPYYRPLPIFHSTSVNQLDFRSLGATEPQQAPYKPSELLNVYRGPATYRWPYERPAAYQVGVLPFPPEEGRKSLE